MARKGRTVVVRGGRQSKNNGGPVLHPTPSTRYNWRLYNWALPNDARGDCWWLSTLQTYLIANGVPPSHAQLALSKDGKSEAEVKKLEELASLMRSLTVEAFKHDHSDEVRWGFDQPQQAWTPAQIEEMARNVKRDVRNENDWVNSILFPGGLGDDRAVLLLAKVLCIPNFALVKPVVANGGDRVLWTTDSNSAPLHGKNMVMIHRGHFEAIAPYHVSIFGDSRLLFVLNDVELSSFFPIFALP